MDLVAKKGKVVRIYSVDKSYHGITYKEVKQTLETYERNKRGRWLLCNI
jgi:hypothetical protein